MRSQPNVLKIFPESFNYFLFLYHNRVIAARV